MDFGKLIEWIKLKPRYLFPVMLFTGLLLFLPNTIKNIFGVINIVDEFRIYIGLVFMFSFVFLVTHALIKIISSIQLKLESFSFLKPYKKYLKKLSSDEKTILRNYINKNTKTQNLNIMNGVATGLEVNNIIYRASQLGYNDASFAFNIQPWAWDYLSKNSELLQ